MEPALGRTFNRADVSEGAPPVAILTHRAWTSRFGGDPAVIGRTVHVDGVATEIVGVMPERYAYPNRETALLLPVSIGVYGVTSYMVSQRTREIGIRVALGARTQEVQRMVVRQGMRLTLLGLVLGILGAIAFTRLMGAILFEISPTDPLTLALVPVALLSVSALACWIPARRASSVDPVKALTAE